MTGQDPAFKEKPMSPATVGDEGRFLLSCLRRLPEEQAVQEGERGADPVPLTLTTLRVWQGAQPASVFRENRGERGRQAPPFPPSVSGHHVMPVPSSTSKKGHKEIGLAPRVLDVQCYLPGHRADTNVLELCSTAEQKRSKRHQDSDTQTTFRERENERSRRSGKEHTSSMSIAETQL